MYFDLGDRFARSNGRDPRAAAAGGDTSRNVHRDRGGLLDVLRVEYDELGLFACAVVNEPDEPTHVLCAAAVRISDVGEVGRAAAVGEVVRATLAGEQVVLVRRARADSPEETLGCTGLPPVAD